MNVQELIESLTAGPAWDGLREARKFLRGPITRMDGLALNRFLSGPGPARRADHAQRSVRIALASDTSLDNLVEQLQLRLLERGFFGAPYQSPFAQLAQEVRDPASGLHRHEPAVVVLAPLTGLWSRLRHPDAAAVDRTVQEAWSHVTALRERFSGLLLLQNVMAPESRPHGILDPRRDLSHADFARAVNLKLAQLCRESGQAHLLDADFLAGRSGTTWPGLHKQHLMAGRPLADELAAQLAADVAAFCAALKGGARKCLALDLDNTLWGGVVGEDGVAGVKLGGAYPGTLYTALQSEIRLLNERGVTLALVSKNNEADAWEVFSQRPEMVLRRADISAHRINWQDKAANLRELAAELNLGLDAFVVLDDNPVERAWIEAALPEVEVCPASDPLEMLRWLTTCRRFDTLAITGEDALRAKSYEAANRRASLAAETDNLEGYLAGLGTEIEVGRLTAAQLPRVAQLTQKTNQFNLTTRRYTESEVLACMNSPEWRVFWCRCRDRFADEGIIGAALVKLDGAAWRLDTFLMSCRVLGRGAEKSFLDAICRHAAAEGAPALTGEYLRTPKNGQTEAFFVTCGFTALERTPERGVWHRPLPLTEGLNPPWITLHTPDFPALTPTPALT